MPALPRIIKPKPFDEVPMEATVSNVKVDVIKVQVWRMIPLNRLYLKWFYIFYVNVLLGWTLCLAEDIFPTTYYKG